jgi:hypothetical protein
MVHFAPNFRKKNLDGIPRRVLFLDSTLNLFFCSHGRMQQSPPQQPKLVQVVRLSLPIIFLVISMYITFFLHFARNLKTFSAHN